MARQTWTLTAPSSLNRTNKTVEWSRAAISDEVAAAALRRDENPAYPTYVYVVWTAARFMTLRVASEADDQFSGATGGPRLSDAFETGGRITLTVGGHVLALSITDDFRSTDRTEPYTWIFNDDSLARVTAWAAEISASDTGFLELDDGEATNAVAPDVAINAVPDGNMGDTVNVTLQVLGGSYDRLTYQWSQSTTQGSRNHEIDDIGTTESITWTRPVVSGDGSATLKVVVTAHGDGTRAINGTTDTSEDIEISRVFFIPDADAPSVEVSTVPNGNERTTHALLATTGGSHAGTYDTLDYNWQCFGNDPDGTFTNYSTAYPDSIDDATSQSPTWTRPSVPDGGTQGVYRDYFLRCTLTAHGTNTHAFRGTSETTSAQVRTRVFDIYDAQAPSLQRIETTNDDPDGTGTVNWNTRNTFLDGLENTPIWFRPVIGADGHYDELTVQYLIKKEADQSWTSLHTYSLNRSTDAALDPPVIKWTRPLVASDERWHFELLVTAEGRDGSAEQNTSDERRETTSVGTVQNHPSPDAPGIQIQSFEGSSWRDGFASHRERSSLSLQVFMRGGTFDNLAYVWTIEDADGTDVTADDTFTHPTENQTFIRLPSVSTTTRYWVQVQVTASGTDTIADSTTTDTATNRSFIDVTPHPAADAPSFDNVADITGKSNNVVRISPEIGNHRGTYDSLTWQWELRTYANRMNSGDTIEGVFDDDTAHYPMMTMPDVGDTATQYVLKGTLTAHGDDIIAEQGTTESSTHEESFWVNPLPLPSTPGSAGFAQPSGTISIHPPTAHEGERVQLHFTPNGGAYDSLRTRWIFEPPTGSDTELSGLDDKTEGTFVVPALDSDGTARIRINVWGRGDGRGYRTGAEGAFNPRGSATFTVIADVRAQDLNVTWIDGDGNSFTINGASVIDEDGFYWPINGIYEAGVDSDPNNKREIWRDGS